jgi:hypothetical protein
MNIYRLLLLAFLLVHKCLNVYDSITMIIFFLSAEIILCISSLLISFPDDALSDSFLHKIDL